VSWGCWRGDGEVFTPIGGLEPAPARGAMAVDGCGWLGRRMDQMARFEETLRRLAVFDEGLVRAGFGLDLGRTSVLDPRTAALLQLGVSVATGSSAVCLEWSAGRALAAGASQDEIADVLLAVVPVAGLGRVVSAAPDLAIALGYDVWAALE